MENVLFGSGAVPGTSSELTKSPMVRYDNVHAERETLKDNEFYRCHVTFFPLKIRPCDAAFRQHSLTTCYLPLIASSLPAMKIDYYHTTDKNNITRQKRITVDVDNVLHTL